jgi:hypothetical protein
MLFFGQFLLKELFSSLNLDLRIISQSFKATFTPTNIL